MRRFWDETRNCFPLAFSNSCRSTGGIVLQNRPSCQRIPSLSAPKHSVVTCITAFKRCAKKNYVCSGGNSTQARKRRPPVADRGLMQGYRWLHLLRCAARHQKTTDRVIWRWQRSRWVCAWPPHLHLTASEMHAGGTVDISTFVHYCTKMATSAKPLWIFLLNTVFGTVSLKS